MAKAQTGDRVTCAGLPAADRRPGLGSSRLKLQLSQPPEETLSSSFLLARSLARSLFSVSPLDPQLGNTLFFILSLISHMWRCVPLILGQTMKPIPKRGGGEKRKKERATEKAAY